MRLRIASGMPGPLSSTEKQGLSRSLRKVRTLISRSPAMPASACWLLMRKLAATCVTWSASAIGGHLESGADHLVEIGLGLGRGMQPDHRQEALDDAAAALGGGTHLLGTNLGLRVGGEFVQQRRLRDHHRQWIVELVRNTG